jgi:putative tricarboxylic transport membrane protein
MKDIDRLNGFFFIIFSLYFAYESLKLPLGGFRHPEAGFFPFGLVLALLLLSGFLLFQTFKKEHRKEWLQFGKGKRRVMFAIAAMVVYVFVINFLGYIVSTFLIMTFLLKGLEKQKWRTTLLVSVPCVVLSYVSFSWYLGVPLPKGIIPI